MQLSDIKSRPLYDALRPDANAKRHIVAAEGEGALGIEAAFADDADVLSRTTIVYTAPADGLRVQGDRLAALGPEALHLLPSIETALTRLAGLLATSRMGTRLYVAGSEDFIGQVRALAAASGLDADAVHCEHRGSLARRVQCVHCKGFMSDVTASPVRCAHCGVPLLVRDHYSRRLGAFMGVSINAEAPDEVPAPEEFRA